MFRSVFIVCVVFASWLGGLLWFVETIPPTTTPANISHSDAIVVLTGGNARIAKALKLLENGHAPMLLISGVLDKAPVSAVIAASGYHGKVPIEKISVDYDATSTVENARHSYAWCQKQGITSIILVTADYHMRRSLLEFHQRTNGIKITPYPVNPLASHRNAWCKDYKVFCLYMNEYHKYIGAFIRMQVRYLIRNSWEKK